MKNVLVIYYSQSGQLTQIAKNFVKPFENSSNYNVTYANIEPEKDYNFPWKGYDFFDAFPESVNKIPCPIKPLEIDHEDFDLIVFAYSVWYMSPSIPSNSFLLSDQAKRLFKGKQIITLLGVRNMWIVAQEYVKAKIKELGGNLIGNIVLQDRTENLTGIVTISYFVFTGKKDRFLRFFPKPGISEKDIESAENFGKIIFDKLESNDIKGIQPTLIKNKAVKVKPYLLSVEKLASERVFKFWANFILKKGGAGDLARKKRISMFRWYFPFAIGIVSPIKYVFFLIFAVFKIRKHRKDIKYYSGIELK